MNTHTYNALRFAALAVAVLVASGCAGTSPRGKYRCASEQEGMPCMSVQAVYEATHDGTVVSPVGKAARQEGAAGDSWAGDSAAGISVEGDSLLLTEQPRSAATFDRPVSHPDGPVRTPAKVLRIWLSPWEDEEGDLHAPGYVYSEIHGRRWSVGVKAPDVSDRLELLTPPLDATQQ